MSGGAYIALSGLRVRSAQLDRAAADIANAGTAGYKSERASSWAAERPTFQATLDSAIDVTAGPSRLDLRPGAVTGTSRELDFAIDGPGFFVLQTPSGLRYTRNGSFTKSADGKLVAADGAQVQGEDGPIQLGAGPVTVNNDGSVLVGGAPAGRLRVVDFADTSGLEREEAGRFRWDGSVAPKPAAGAVKGGALEQANVSIVERVANLTEVTRSFEALNRGITVLMNDLDARAISELGRR
jgi:flagellar basal-body rod protein FlgF